jgi:hypothetical protein
MTAVAAAAIRGAASRAAELPGYQLAGLPITSHQVALLGGADVREQSPVATLTVQGMPASPSQIAILTPRPRMTSMIENPPTVGAASK